MLAACSDDATQMHQPSVVTVAFAARTLMLPEIDLTATNLRLDRLQVLGNVPPPGSSPDRPPPQGPRPEIPRIDLDVLSTGTTGSIEDLPQGLYSRVRFILGRVSLDGVWRNTRFHLSLAPFGTIIVDMRASTPQELSQAGNITFDISVDPNLWFPPGVFYGAALDGRGEIVVDDTINVPIGMAILQSMPRSFTMP
jgi:hypothetical protein